LDGYGLINSTTILEWHLSDWRYRSRAGDETRRKIQKRRSEPTSSL
jgi:hypothetical protein